MTSSPGGARGTVDRPVGSISLGSTRTLRRGREIASDDTGLSIRDEQADDAKASQLAAFSQCAGSINRRLAGVAQPKPRRKLSVLDLFSGIGGFSLGLERTGGFRTVAFCEIEDYPRQVLARHWPDVPCFPDVTKLRGEDVGPVDVICGGFPCQDISLAGAGAGLAGERSGLWREYARLIGELGPRYVIVENVAALLGRGLGDVLRDLAALGYDAEWHCIPASAIGAPHRRDRIWIVGHANDKGKPAGAVHGEMEELRGLASATAHANGQHGGPWRPWGAAWLCARDEGLSGTAADADQPGLEVRKSFGIDDGAECQAVIGSHWRLTEPPVCRADDGLSHRVDRLKALGNAVVPEIVELIGRAILAAEQEKRGRDVKSRRAEDGGAGTRLASHRRATVAQRAAGVNGDGDDDRGA